MVLNKMLRLVLHLLSPFALAFTLKFVFNVLHKLYIMYRQRKTFCESVFVLCVGYFEFQIEHQDVS